MQGCPGCCGFNDVKSFFPLLARLLLSPCRRHLWRRQRARSCWSSVVGSGSKSSLSSIYYAIVVSLRVLLSHHLLKCRQQPRRQDSASLQPHTTLCHHKASYTDARAGLQRLQSTTPARWQNGPLWPFRSPTRQIVGRQSRRSGSQRGRALHGGRRRGPQ